MTSQKRAQAVLMSTLVLVPLILAHAPSFFLPPPATQVIVGGSAGQA